MKAKYLILAALLAACLAGCDVQDADPSVSASIPECSTIYTVPMETEPATIPAESAPAFPAGTYQMQFEDEENDAYMEYYVFVPENATENMPLLIFLHGDGEVGHISLLENNALIVRVREIYGDNFPFIVIAPCTHMQTWIDWGVPDTLKKLLDHTVNTYCIDTEKIMITGHSRGAVGVWNMVNTYGDYFSAAVPISCFSWRYIDENVITQVPIRAFCGNLEDYERGYCTIMRAQIQQIVLAGGDAELTLFEGANHMKTPELTYTEDLFQWMLEQ